ncbi:MAG: kynureninase [Anaerolineales bacterium]
MNFHPTRSFALEMDARDELASFRDAFLIHDPNLLYMDGNSLGRLPKTARERLQTVIEEEWGRDLIRSWNNAGWWQAPIRVGEKIAPLLGAAPGQVIVTDSVSLNLFKLSIAALNLLPHRQRILTDALNFPSDLYILQGIVRLLGGRHEIVRINSRDNDVTPDLDQLTQALDENTALVTFSHVLFKSGYLYDMQEITHLAHQKGALVLWDLSHSAGAVPVELDACEVDFAVGCTYKYLNGGPGAPAFLYVNRRLQEKIHSPIWGWWGQTDPFAFDLDYSPANGVNRFLLGSQPILSLLTLEAALEPLLQAGMERIRQKSIQLTEYLIYLVDQYLVPFGFTLGSPRDFKQRGSHVSIRHPEGYRINRALIEEMKVIPDFRAPDNIRLGVAPLYTSFLEVWETVGRIRQVTLEKRYEKYPQERLTVT